MLLLKTGGVQSKPTAPSIPSIIKPRPPRRPVPRHRPPQPRRRRGVRGAAAGLRRVGRGAPAADGADPGGRRRGGRRDRGGSLIFLRGLGGRWGAGLQRDIDAADTSSRSPCPRANTDQRGRRRRRGRRGGQQPGPQGPSAPAARRTRRLQRREPGRRRGRWRQRGSAAGDCQTSDGALWRRGLEGERGQGGGRLGRGDRAALLVNWVPMQLQCSFTQPTKPIRTKPQPPNPSGRPPQRLGADPRGRLRPLPDCRPGALVGGCRQGRRRGGAGRGAPRVQLRGRRAAGGGSAGQQPCTGGWECRGWGASGWE